MHWTSVVSFLRDKRNQRGILVGCIAVWNSWKIRLAFKNLYSALHNHIDDMEPNMDTAFSESASVIIESIADLVLKAVKLKWNFHSYIWHQTSESLGLQGQTSRALCYLFIVNVVQLVEKVTKLLVIWQIATRKKPLKTVVTQAVLNFNGRTASVCLDVISHSIFRWEVVWILNLAWKLFNFCIVQPLILFRSQLSDGTVPSTLLKKAAQLDFPADRIRIGSGPEPRARYLKVIFRDYIMVNKSLLNILDDDHLLIIFCRELAHWELGHTYVRGFFAVFEFVVGDLVLLACGTDAVSSFHHFEPGVHIAVHVSVMKYFVQSMLCSLIHGFGNTVNARMEMRADEFATYLLKMNSSSILAHGPRWGCLMEAWKKLAPVDPENYQFFDEAFAAFFYGQPTIPYRLNKAERRLRFSPDVESQGKSSTKSQ